MRQIPNGTAQLAEALNGSRSANVLISAAPKYEYALNPAQYIDTFEDSSASFTYGSRYVFGELDQKTFSAGLRLNWTFSPTLSLQLYGQPLVSAGKYTDFKELAIPRSFTFNHYSETGHIQFDGEKYVIDPDGPGPGLPVQFDNPDFNFQIFTRKCRFTMGISVLVRHFTSFGHKPVRKMSLLEIFNSRQLCRKDLEYPGRQHFYGEVYILLEFLAGIRSLTKLETRC